MIPKDISSCILTIGPDYKKGGGGVAKLIESYSSCFEQFYFVSCSCPGGNMKKMIIFFQSVIMMTYYIIFKDIKIVHIHSVTTSLAKREKYYVYLAKIFKLHIIIHMHDGNIEYGFNIVGRKLLKIFKYVDCVIPVSKYVENVLLNHVDVKSKVIYNIVDYPKEIGNHTFHEGVQCLFLGSINHHKGIFDVLEMVSVYQMQLRGHFCLYVGGKGDVKELESLIIKNNIADLVSYVGWCDKDEKNRLLNMTDIYIQPSYCEAFGISIVEAMSYGIPIISTNIGGIPEIVENGVSGFLVNPGDINEMYKKILALMDLDIRKRMGWAAMEKSRKFVNSSYEKELLKIYKSELK